MIPKCRVSLKMTVLQLVIAILLMLVDEGRSAKRLKTSLFKFCALLAIADWVSLQAEIIMTVAKAQSRRC